MKLNRLKALAVLTLAALPTTGRAAALRYSVTNLTSLYSINQEPRHFGEALALNNKGDVLIRDLEYNDLVGTPRVSTLTVEHQDGTTTSFPIPYATGYASQVRMNNLGEVAALVFPDRDNIDLTTREVWVYTAAGVASKLEGMTGMENLSFNDLGQVAVSNTDENRTFRYTPGVGWENLGSLSDDGFAVPRGINNAGAVVGGTSIGASDLTTPFLYRDGTGMESIPAAFGLGRAINDDFVVTGDGGFVYFANEMRMEYVGGQSFGFIRSQDINELEQIIGVATGGTSQTAFLWDEVNGYQILTNILEDTTTWHIAEAYAINNDGWILGVATPRNEPNGAGAYVLLRPVPEPGPLLLLVLAGAPVFSRRRILTAPGLLAAS